MLRRLTVILILFIQVQVCAQHSTYNFYRLNEKDGLSYNVVNCFLRSKTGNLWIGTYNGFNRFDGSNFYTYKIRKGKNSLQSEVIHSLCEDKRGTIFGSTDNGLFRYNPQTDSFTNYSIQSFGRNSVFYEIVQDQQGQIWASGIWSLFKYDEKNDKFEEIVKTIEQEDSIQAFKIGKNSFLEDESGKGFWIATNTGLIHYDKVRNKMISQKTNPQDAIFKRTVTSALCKSRNHCIWYIDNEDKNVIQFDTRTNQIQQQISLKKYIPNTYVISIFEDKNQHLWMCTWTYDKFEYDMFKIDPKSKDKIIKIEHNDNDTRSISSTFFWDAFQDENNTLWFGTLNGISRCNPEGDIYRSYNLLKFIPELSNKHIYKIQEDSTTHNLWIACSNNGLINYNPKNNQYHYYDLNKSKPNKFGNTPSAVNRVYRMQGDVVLATYSGAWQLNSKQNNWEPYTLLPKEYTDFTCSEIISVGDSQYYFNNGKEILFWNRNSNYSRLIKYPTDKAMPENKTIIAYMMRSQNGVVWFKSYNGHIAYIDRNFNIQKVLIYDDRKDNGGGIVSLKEDSQSNLYILYKSRGLYRYNPRSKQLNFWNEPDGLPGNRIHISDLDNRNRVWMAMYNKICVYLPEGNKFINFSIPYSESDYNYTNSMVRRSNGEIVVNINNELFGFNPNQLLNKPFLQTPQISQLVTSKQHFEFPINKPIVLNADENTIRIFFGSFINAEIYPYDVEYKLEGAEKLWTVAGTNKNALYNNLASGKYIFKVRLRSKNNIWQTKESALAFEIKTPFYRSYWFYSLLICFVLIMAYSIYKYRINQKNQLIELERKTEILEKEKAMVMYENLKQQLNPHFLFNSLTSLNSLIQINQDEASTFLENLSKTYRYILKSRDAETVPLLDELNSVEHFIQLQKIRFEKGFDVQINIDPSYHVYKIVPVTIQNLLENAIKHNIIDVDSPLIVSLFVKEDYLCIQNNLQKKRFVETSNKQGLAQMQSLYTYLSSKPLIIEETSTFFTVKIPLI